jgi:TrmH family RNA methyltransferase
MIKSITSRDNPQYKELKLLATRPPARRKQRRTLLDGVHLCEAYLQHVGIPEICVVSDQGMAHSEVSKLVAECESRQTQCLCLPEALYRALSQVENGVDLLFIVQTPDIQVAGKLDHAAVLLDNVQDPGNVGSILRSAAAAGIRHVYCGDGTVFAWSPKVLRAGMGAHFLLQIYESVELFGLVRDAAVPVLATSSHADRSIYEVDLKRPLAWLFGHEGQGVNAELLACATEKVVIPHRGAMESLNVAASAAVCFFEQLRQSSVS